MYKFLVKMAISYGCLNLRDLSAIAFQQSFLTRLFSKLIRYIHSLIFDFINKIIRYLFNFHLYICVFVMLLYFNDIFYFIHLNYILKFRRHCSFCPIINIFTSYNYKMFVRNMNEVIYYLI